MFLTNAPSLFCDRQQTSETVDGRVSGKPCEMYHLYVNELSKMLRLLLMLANRLARADNALVIMKDDSNNHKVVFLNSVLITRLAVELKAAKTTCRNICCWTTTGTFFGSRRRVIE